MDWRNPKDPLNVAKAVRLRDRAGVLKGRADSLLREADPVLAEAQALEDAARDQKRTEKLVCPASRALARSWWIAIQGALDNGTI